MRFIEFDLRNPNITVKEKNESVARSPLQLAASGLKEVAMLWQMLMDPALPGYLFELLEPLDDAGEFADLSIGSLAMELQHVAAIAAQNLYLYEDLATDGFQSTMAVFDIAKTGLIKLTGVEGVVALMLADEIPLATKRKVCIEALLEDRYGLSDGLLEGEVALLLWLTQKTSLLPMLIDVFSDPRANLQTDKVLPVVMQMFCHDKVLVPNAFLDLVGLARG